MRTRALAAAHRAATSAAAANRAAHLRTQHIHCAAHTICFFI